MIALGLLLGCAGDALERPVSRGGDSTCDEGSCAGCCLPDGSCQAGFSDEECGADGESCADCTEVGNACDDAVCVNEARTELDLVDDSTQHILDEDDAARLRDEIIDFIWREEGFPEDARPDLVVEDVDAPYAGALAARVDRLVIDLGDDYVSTVYVFHPGVHDGGLALAHQGHDPALDASGIDTATAFFLDRGDIVLAFSMPLYGEYTGPADSHDAMIIADDPRADFHPLRYFLEPVAAALGYALDNWSIDSVVMTGVSGGGWTTTVYAAIDPRVQLSLPVAGSLPNYLRDETDLGDMEQYDQPFYSIAGYLDLYVLGGWGEGRAQRQVLNRYDTCCFSGLRYQDYAEAVSETVERLGAGQWDVFLDESHDEHTISEHALAATFDPLLDEEGVQLADDLSPAWGAFATVGDWTATTGQGFGADQQSVPAGSGQASASWTFTVAPGAWNVYATWTDREDQASDAPYTLFGDEEITARADQRAAPDDLDDLGGTWAYLGRVDVSGGTLIVRLTDEADGTVIADGVRVSPAGGTE